MPTLDTRTPDYVSGDWFIADELTDGTRYSTIYPCRVVTTWNGWAVPAVTLDTLLSIVDDASEVLSVGPDGELYVADGSGETWSADLLSLRMDDGLFALDIGWCWDQLDSGDFTPDRGEL